MTTTKIINRLKTAILTKKIHPKILSIYIYGSMLTNNLRSDSDIDIAILPTVDIKNEKKLELLSITENYIYSVLKEIGITKEVSVLDMSGKYASLQLLYKINRISWNLKMPL